MMEFNLRVGDLIRMVDFETYSGDASGYFLKCDYGWEEIKYEWQLWKDYAKIEHNEHRWMNVFRRLSNDDGSSQVWGQEGITVIVGHIPREAVAGIYHKTKGPIVEAFDKHVTLYGHEWDKVRSDY